MNELRGGVDLGTDDVPLALRVRDKIVSALMPIADEGRKAIDTGGGLGGFDLWVTIDGYEWIVQVSQGKRRGPTQ
jgi:hypothetical protein